LNFLDNKHFLFIKGYLKNLIPKEAPEESEDWKDVMNGMVLLMVDLKILTI